MNSHIVLLLQLTGQFLFHPVKTCNIPTNLPASKTEGVISTTKIIERRRCGWTLPNTKYPNEILFIYIPGYDFYNATKCTADIEFRFNSGTGPMSCQSEEPVCFIFMESFSLINFEYIKQQIKPIRCSSWKVEEDSLNAITFRKFNRFKGNEINITYKYISPNSKTKQTVTEIGAETTSTLTSAETIQRRETDAGDPIEKTCNCGTYVAVMTIFILLFFVLIALMCLFLHKKKALFQGQQPRARGSFFHAESVDDDVTDDNGMEKRKSGLFTKSFKSYNRSQKKSTHENLGMNGNND